LTGIDATSYTVEELELEGLHVRHTGLTPELGRVYERSAAVCLDEVHSPPVQIDVTENPAGKRVYGLNWRVSTEHEHRAYKTQIDTTEWGAYGVALATVERHLGLVALERAEVNTGADYVLLLSSADNPAMTVNPGDNGLDYEQLVRLEVSGTLHGSDSVAQTRLAQKCDQLRAGKSDIPRAVAAVVGFAAKGVWLERID
jgi:hypothetical protein